MRLLFALLAFCATAIAASTPNLKDVGWQQHPGTQLPLQLTFTDEHGAQHPLRDYFGHLPAVIVFGYFSCPKLCPIVAQSAAGALSQTRLHIGRDAQLIVISIDPQDGPATMAHMSAPLASLAQSTSIRLLTTPTDHAAQLASVAGFHYTYDAAQQQFAHPAGIVIATPGGLISRYFEGVQFDPAELRSAIRAARDEQVGGIAQRLLLLCYHFDESTGHYSSIVMSLLRWTGVLMALGAVWVIARRRTRVP